MAREPSLERKKKGPHLSDPQCCCLIVYMGPAAHTPLLLSKLQPTKRLLSTQTGRTRTIEHQLRTDVVSVISEASITMTSPDCTSISYRPLLGIENEFIDTERPQSCFRGSVRCDICENVRWQISNVPWSTSTMQVPSAQLTRTATNVASCKFTFLSIGFVHLCRLGTACPLLADSRRSVIANLACYQLLLADHLTNLTADFFPSSVLVVQSD